MGEAQALRLAVIVALALTIGVSAGYRLRARAAETIPRSREPAWLRWLRAGLALPTMAAIVAHLAAPGWMAWAEAPLGSGWRWLGAALALASAPLAAWTLRTLGANVSETIYTKSSHRLVTSGPYRWVRHPLYTGGFLLLAGVALATASVPIAALAVVTIVLLRLVVVPREEAELGRRFGDEYQRYRRRTGALLPRIPRGGPGP